MKEKKEVIKMKRIVIEYDVLMAKHMEVSDEEYERLKNEKEPPQDIYDKLDRKLNEEYDGSAAIRIIRSEEWDYSENKTRPIFHFEYKNSLLGVFLFSFFEMGFWRAAHGSGFAWAAQISIIPHPSHFVKSFCENFF